MAERSAVEQRLRAAIVGTFEMEPTLIASIVAWGIEERALEAEEMGERTGFRICGESRARELRALETE